MRDADEPDMQSETHTHPPAAPSDATTPSASYAPDVPTTADLTALVERLFFAYRDFTGEPDTWLADRGLGRAHHRVLHFVDRHPGLAVHDLLDILKITKQSLARVLKQLIDDGYIVQQRGPTDRRERRLFATDAGRDLACQLITMQLARIESGVQAAINTAGPDAPRAVSAFLSGMVSADDRASVDQLMAVATRHVGPEPQDAPAAPRRSQTDAADTHEMPACGSVQGPAHA